MFTNGIDELKELHKSGDLDGVYTTNLSYIMKSTDEKWLHIVDCSHFLALAINNLHNGESISNLLRDKSYTGKVLAKKFNQNKK